jgi:zinc protease
MYELLHDRHRIRRWRIGREEGLRRLRRDDVLGFYRNFYRPSTTVLVIVGDIDPDAVMARVQQLYGDIPAGEPQRTPGEKEDSDPGFRYRELSGDIAQTQIALGWRTPGTLHPDSPALDMLATVLGAGRASRLYRAARERKLVTTISCFNYTPRDVGVFAIQAESPPERAAAALDAIWDQLRRIRDEGVGTLELERARRITESRWVRRLEDMEGQANYIAEWEALGNWELGERYYERMLATSADDVREVARRYIKNDQVAILVYRPATTPVVAPSGEALRAHLEQAKAEPLEDTAAVAQPVAAMSAVVPRKSREEVGVHVYTLPSGVPVLVKRRADSPLTYIGAFALGGGSAERPEFGGRTMLMARTAVKGTARRSAVRIAEDGEMLGGSVSAHIGGDSVGWTISVPASHTAAAVELLADVALRPTFADAALETERAIALSEVATLRDDMYRYPMRLAIQTAFAGHPYGVPALGTEDSLRAQTRADLERWHREQFLEGATALGIVGDDDPDTLAELLARHFEALRHRAPVQTPTPAWPESARGAVERRDKAQTAMVLSWPSPARSDPARFDVAMIAGVASGLGGRLFEELRDKQSLCYTVHAFATERRAAGTFSAYIATSPDKEDLARDGLLRELQKMRDEPVTAEELQRAQMYALGTHAIRQQSGAAVLAEIVDAWMFGSLAELDEFEARVRAVTARGMMETAQRYFDPARRVEGIVRGVGKTV